MGNLTELKLPSGKIQTMEYDALDRQIRSVDGEGVEIRREFDLSDRMISSTDGLDRITRYFYDSNGNLDRIVDPEGNSVRYSYDSRNLLSTVRDQIGNSASYSYDELGRMVEETKPDGSTVAYSYDAVGNQTSITDELGKTKRFSYDALNRRVSYTDEDGKETKYSYDSVSNLTEQERPDGSEISYSYDARNMLTAATYPSASDKLSYSYDALGRKTSEKRGSGAPTVFSYDAVGQLLSQGEGTDTVSYSFDPDGNLASVGYPSGRSTEYGYDLAGREASVTSSGSISSSFSYDAAAQLTGSALGNGTAMSFSYTGIGQRKGFSLADSSAAELLSRSYELNPLGEALSARTAVGAQETVADSFSYDSRSRLTAQSSGLDATRNLEFGYGVGSNLTKLGSATQVFSDAGRLLSSGTVDFSYDALGNRTSDSAGSSYSWSSAGLLTEAEEGNSTVEYEYNPSGLIAERSEGSASEDFLWDLSREIPVLLSDGEFEYIYESDGRTPFAQVEISSGAVKYLHRDLNGSIVGATDQSGILSGTVNYDPYGSSEDAPVSSFGYAGEWIDPTTGLSYNRARWLDIATGSFLSEDPLVQLTVSAYSYTDGNPLIQFDPLGLFTFDPISFIDTYSEEIGVGFTAATILFGATPAGPVLLVAGALFSAYTGVRDVQSGRYGDAALSFAGAIPGVAAWRLGKAIPKFRDRYMNSTSPVDWTRRSIGDSTRKLRFSKVGFDRTSNALDGIGVNQAFNKWGLPSVKLNLNGEECK